MAIDDSEENLENEEEPTAYILSKRDKGILSAALLFLEKITRASFTRPAQLVSVAKVLHLLKRLPNTSNEEFDIRIEICGPTRYFGPNAISHSWCVQIEGRLIQISSHGYFSRESTGGDSFTAMRWNAAPGEEAIFEDYLEHLDLVDDAKPFPEEIEELNLTESDFSLSVEDDDNPLLQEMDSKNAY